MKKNSFVHRILAPSPFKLGFLLVLISVAIYYSFHNQKPQILNDYDNRITDTMFHIRGPQATTGEVVIVAIDHKSINKYGQWPWPRNIIAQLTDTIARQEPASISLDVVFAGPDRTSPQNLISELLPHTKNSRTQKTLQKLQGNLQFNYDLLLGEALAKTSSVLAYSFLMDIDGEDQTEGRPASSLKITTAPQNISLAGSDLFVAQKAMVNTPTIAVRAKTEGFLNILADNSGVVRKSPLVMLYKGLPYPSLAVESFRIGKDMDQAVIRLEHKAQTGQQKISGMSIGDTFIPTDEKGQLLINYRGPFQKFSYLSAADILSSQEEHDLADKHVIIGIAAQGLYETHTTPYTYSIPGVEIQANIIDNIIAGDPLTHDSDKEVLLTFILLVAGGPISFGTPCLHTASCWRLGRYCCSVGTTGYKLFFLSAEAGRRHHLSLCLPHSCLSLRWSF